MERQVTLSVFTKPWKMPLSEQGRLVSGLGFEAIELPVRPGSQVEPGEVERGLPAAARVGRRLPRHVVPREENPGRLTVG